MIHPESWSRLPSPKSWIHYLVFNWPWLRYLTGPCFCFFIGKMETPPKKAKVDPQILLLLYEFTCKLTLLSAKVEHWNPRGCLEILCHKEGEEVYEVWFKEVKLNQLHFINVSGTFLIVRSSWIVTAAIIYGASSTCQALYTHYL